MARRGRDTGEGVEYSAREEAAVAEAVDTAYAAWGRDSEPDAVNVRAQIEWSGHVMEANNGVRRTRLHTPGPTAMRKVRDAVAKWRTAKGKTATARPIASMKAKGWHAKLNALTSHARGNAAAEKAGLAPTARTLVAWLSEERAPSKANQAKIDAAYDALRNWRVEEARTDTEKAAHEVVQAMTEALETGEGARIRFRDIEDFRFE